MAYARKELIGEFRKFYGRDAYHSQIAEIVSRTRGKKSIVIDYGELSEFDPEIVEMLPEDPETVIGAAEDALIEHINDVFGITRKDVHARFCNFPEEHRTSIRYLRSADVGKFLVLEALVKKASEVRPKLIEGAFMCSDCRSITMQRQEGSQISEPFVCSYCDKTRKEVRFKLVPHRSVFIDEERLEVQELPEKLEGGQQPQRIVVLAEDDMAGILAPGDRIILYGVLNALPRVRGSSKTTTFDFIFHMNYVEKENKEYTDIEPDEEDIEKIEAIAYSENALEQVADSIAPTIYGHYYIKKALALQLFGGVSKEMPDGTHIRGDIHILLVGDPGTAKSQLLRYMSNLSPRGVYASGKSASAAGLTAAAVKDEGGDGRWTLEAGALVMADGGMACIDEMDKMSRDDRSSMHEAMEQQTITVVKAGISATLKSRCALLGAANPKNGRFSPKSKTNFEEIDLPAPLLSRFDTVFIILDEKNQRRDRDIAEHILKGHRIGEMLKNGQEIPLYEKGTHIADIPPELLKKYVSYAKRKNPVMTEEAMESILAYYLKTRKKGESGTVAITARHLEAMVRMAEASARIRLSDKVERKDAEIATDIMEIYIAKVLNYDAIMQSTKESVSTRTKRAKILEIINTLFKEKNNQAPLSDIIARAEEENISRMEVEEIVDKLRKAGEIIEKRNELYGPGD